MRKRVFILPAMEDPRSSLDSFAFYEGKETLLSDFKKAGHKLNAFLHRVLQFSIQGDEQTRMLTHIHMEWFRRQVGLNIDATTVHS